MQEAPGDATLLTRQTYVTDTHCGCPSCGNCRLPAVLYIMGTKIRETYFCSTITATLIQLHRHAAHLGKWRTFVVMCGCSITAMTHDDKALLHSSKCAIWQVSLQKHVTFRSVQMYAICNVSQAASMK